MNVLSFFYDKVVFITGSARGIGRETARLALQSGARVILHAREWNNAEKTRTALQRPDRTAVVAGDLSNRETARKAVSDAEQVWGRIDILINNAGQSMRGSWSEVEPETVITLIESNFLAALWTTQACLPALRRSKGRIGYVSTLAALRGFPGAGLYSATKMSLTGFQQSLAAGERKNGIISSEIFLPFVENDPEKTILDASGQRFQHQRNWSWTQVKAASAILTNMARGRSRAVLTPLGQALSWGQFLIPRVVDAWLAHTNGRTHAVRQRNA